MPPATALQLPEPPAFAGGLIYVAFSGGLDSTVLLYALHGLYRARVRALHVHHGLQVSAEDWAQHCAQLCGQWGIAFRRLDVTVRNGGEGVEAAARKARYAALREQLAPGDLLATAHHRDDQAETFLLQALRGAGAGGLAGMRGLQRCGRGWLWRPLLELPRAALRAYAQAHALRWVEDPHNRDERYLRSRLRHRVLPELESWAPASAGLARSAAWCRESAELMSALAALDLAEVQRADGVSVDGLLALSPARRKNLLRHWLTERCGLPPPRRSTLDRVDAELLLARGDAEPRLCWPGGELRRYRDRLFAMRPRVTVDPAWARSWHGLGELVLPDGGLLRCSVELPPAEVRFARPGERFRPRGGAHRRRFKSLFQERAVAPWQRACAPLVCWEREVRWAGGIGPAQDAPPWAERLEWLPPGGATAR